MRFADLPNRWLGLELVKLDKNLGDYFGTDQGLLVVRAPEDSNLPLKSGDVLTKIGDRDPNSPKQALRILRSYDPGETINVELLRHGKKQTVALKVPRHEER